MSPTQSLLGSALVLSAIAIALPLGVAIAPVPTALTVLVTAGGVVALRSLGGKMTLWCLFVATIPSREALSIDLVGTKTIYLNDVILLPLLAVTLYEHGLGRIWRRSSTFRIGVAFVAAGAVGIYTATRWVWALGHLYQESFQLIAFYVAWQNVRDVQRARWTLLAFVAGMIPAAIYGLYQSTLPATAVISAEGHVQARVWDAEGNPHVRPQSTFWNVLAYSLALTVAFSISAGWMFLARSAGSRLVAAGFAIGFLVCNQLTYSVGGLVASVAGVGAAILLVRRRWMIVALPLVGLLWLMIAPTTFVHRIDQIVRGEHTSLAIRLVGYGQALEILRDHPVFGVGWGNIATEMEGEYRAIKSHGGLQPRSAENYFLNRAMALGGIGLGLALAVCVLFIRNVLTRRPSPLATGADRWPQEALVIAGVVIWVQMQAQPSADPVSRYLLWTLFALAERMRMAYRGES